MVGFLVSNILSPSTFTRSGFDGQLKGKGIVLIAHPNFVACFFAARININGHWQFKYLPILALLQVNGLGFGGIIPFIADIQYRVACTVIPLVKKPV
jgi:hypothetical protein